MTVITGSAGGLKPVITFQRRVSSPFYRRKEFQLDPRRAAKVEAAMLLGSLADLFGLAGFQLLKPQAITRPAMSSVLRSSPAAVLSTPRQSRESSFRAKYRLRR